MDDMIRSKEYVWHSWFNSWYELFGIAHELLFGKIVHTFVSQLLNCL